jgi:hypothetical protein
VVAGLVIKASGPETGGAYSIVEFTAPVGGEWTIPYVHRGEEEGWQQHHWRHAGIFQFDEVDHVPRL